MAAIIEARGLTKDFRIYLRQRGLRGAMRTLFSSEHRVVHAVRGLDLEIPRGELVGFIGANGAGKSTTIKMLSGVLHPTSGEVRVCGRVPHRNRKQVASRIGVMFGQRSQLQWDLPLIESFDLLRWIYGIDAARYRRNLDELVGTLEASSFLNSPVRTLSLGQRARGDLIAVLLHDPEVLFLDEPTIGLDVATRDILLDHIQDINRRRGVTVVFTTHDLINLEKLCERIVIIDRGALVFDGARAELRNHFGTERSLVVQFREPVEAIAFPGELAVREREGHSITMAYHPERENLSEILALLERSGTVVDVAVSPPTIESVVKRLLHEPAPGRQKGLGAS